MLFVAVAIRGLTLAAVAQLPLFASPDVDAAVYDAAARRIAGGDHGLGHPAASSRCCSVTPR